MSVSGVVGAVRFDDDLPSSVCTQLFWEPGWFPAVSKYGMHRVDFDGCVVLMILFIASSLKHVQYLGVQCQLFNLLQREKEKLHETY